MAQTLVTAVDYKADNFGCGFYRMIWPGLSLQTGLRLPANFRIQSMMNPVTDARWYIQTNPRVVRIQRWIGQDRMKFVTQFLKPLSQRLGFWLVYQIDDVVVYDQIPKYNMAKEAYSPQRIGDSPKQIMSACDYITVTTDQLAKLYSEHYGIPREKFLVIPNYLPRWWISQSFNYDRQMAMWKDTRKKPRIAFACSLNHFDVKGANGGVDDFSHVVPWIQHHINAGTYQFIFVGSVPKQLQKYIAQKKIQYQPPSDILNYPYQMEQRKIDLLVAPLCKNRFNQCKSNIKWLEFSALGIPMLLQNLVTYTPYVDPWLLFNDANQLEEKVKELFFKPTSQKLYSHIILQNKSLVQKDPRFAPRGWWLQANLDKWLQLYGADQKTMLLDLTKPGGK